MIKEIILLAKSRKHSNYCVAGKDIHTGEWIRLISRNEMINNAIEAKDLIYTNKSEANLLDVISVEVEEVEIKNRYQPENYYLNDKYYLGFGCKKTIQDLNNFIDDTDEIFFNKAERVSVEELNDIKDINSLLLIKADIVKVKLKEGRENRLIANIKYKENWYNGLTITDIDFTKKYYEKVSNIENNKGLNLYDQEIVISLGECYKGHHYKLVATIFA